jgi:Ca2+-binding RTX toxin-like protein
MKINPIYDAAANNDPAFRNDIQAAIDIYDSIFTADISVNIKFGDGEIDGTPIPQNVSEGGISVGARLTYATLVADLQAAEPGFFTSAMVPSGSSINGHSSFIVSSAQARIFGILSAHAGAGDIDGTVGIGTGFTAGGLRIAGALHEIGHALGRVPGSELDLFRFTGVGTRLFGGGNTAPAAYFSLDGGVTRLANWGQTSDPSDFLASGGSLTPNDAFNEFVSAQSNHLSAVDLAVMRALGFSTQAATTVPGPPDPSHTFTYNGGHAVFVGGSGVDTLDLSGFASAVLVNFNLSGTQVYTTDASSLQLGTWRAIADLTSIENIVGANADTTFYGDSHDNTFSYVGGHDIFDGGGGRDTLDLSRFGSAAVLINLNIAGNNVATTDAPTLHTGAWRPLVDVSGVYSIVGANADTTLYGDPHNNTFTYVGGHDVFDGGGGSDTLDLSGFSSAAVLINLNIAGNNVATTDAPTLQTGAWRPLVDVSGVYSIKGANADTTLYGDPHNNTFTYVGGHDVFDGGGGSDTLDLSGFSSAAVLINLKTGGNNVATTDAPTLQTGAWRPLVDVSGVYSIKGANANSTLYGDSHNNTFTYVGGHDVFDGGGGSDTLDLSGFGSGAVLVNLTVGGNNVATTDAPTLQTGAWRPLVDISGVESVILSQGNATVYGDTRANVITAGGGNDFMVGGGGNDTFVFRTNFARDTIHDFGPGDVIQFDHTQFTDFAAILAHTSDDGLGNTVITYDANHAVTLDHVLKAGLTAAEFLIV